MTRSDNTMEDLIAEAERLGKENDEIERKNKKRRAKGRPPLPDPQEKKDMEVGRMRYRTGDATTVDGADAMKLFEMRKAEMSHEDCDDDDDEDRSEPAVSRLPPKVGPRPRAVSEEDAAKEAAAARRIQDLKNGRIDHEGNWSNEGQSLDRGDATVVVDKTEVAKIWGMDKKGLSGIVEDLSRQIREDAHVQNQGKESESGQTAAGHCSVPDLIKDMYKRLGTSFEAIERTLSDLQGRVSEIVTATTPNEPEEDPESKARQFDELLSRSTPVVFNVEGTQMSFDAITVFHAPPCITVVSNIGSAKITPKPGARLLMSYDMDGNSYVDDPVVFLGTRFDLPMFGLSFVGFIRDLEAGMMDVAAGVSGEPHESVES